MKNIAADIGNTRFKLEWQGRIFPLMCHLTHPEELARAVAEVQEAAGDAFTWWVSSVHRATLGRLQAWLAENRPQDAVRVLNHAQLPISLDVEVPEKVGMDRLLAAVAADARREPGRAAVVVDFGTAITVDLLDADGVFRGGAIMPGAEIAADALHTYTDALPRVSLAEDISAAESGACENAAKNTPPFSPVGKNTRQAIQAGLYWSAVGAIRELTVQMAKNLAFPPHLYLTGGGAELAARGLGAEMPWQVVPEMVLEGVREVINRNEE